ncbi:MAG: hypothetical protein ACRYHA_05715 [Janthinobacterium lividum]
MIWTPAEVIAHLSTLFAIGGPSDPYGNAARHGAGAGDVLLARTDGLSDLGIPIAGA